MNKELFDKAQSILNNISHTKSLLEVWSNNTHSGTIGTMVKDAFKRNDADDVFMLIDSIVKEKLTNKINDLRQQFKEL